MPRMEAEILASTGGTHPDTTGRKCSSCGAIGKFASDSSDEFREFANDLVFWAYAAHLQNKETRRTAKRETILHIEAGFYTDFCRRAGCDVAEKQERQLCPSQDFSERCESDGVFTHHSSVKDSPLY